MYLNFQGREILRKNLKTFFVKNPHATDAIVVNHFMQEGYARATIYNNNKRCRECKNAKQQHNDFDSKV